MSTSTPPALLGLLLPEPPPPSRGRTVALALLVLVVLGGPLFRGLGRSDLRNDEAIYSYVAERIAETGDWLWLENPHGGEFLEKPPLKMWLTAAGLRSGLLPPGEAGLRAIDAACGALALLYIFLIGNRLIGPLGGLAAALVTYANPAMVFDHGLRSNNMEALLLLSYCGGFHHLLAWARTSGRAALVHALAFAAWFAAGFLDKFVAALFLPAVGGLAVLLVRSWRDKAWRERRAWAGAAALALLLVAPWFVYQSLDDGRHFWRVILGTHVLDRVTQGLDPTHREPAAYYLVRLWGQVFRFRPAVAAGALLWLARVLYRRSPDGLLVVLWFALPTAALSLATSKLYYYAYPFFPPVALAAGLALSLVARLGYEAARALESRLLPGPRPAARRRLLVGLGLPALAILVATLAGGPIDLVWGPLHLTNAHPWRPAALLGLALVLLALPRASVAGTVAAVLLLWPTAAQFRHTWHETGRGESDLRDFTDCLRAAVPPAGATVVVHFPRGLPLMNHVYYYVRRLPLYRPDEPNPRQLRQALASGRAIAFIHEPAYAALSADRRFARVLRGARVTVNYNARLVVPEALAACRLRAME